MNDEYIEKYLRMIKNSSNENLKLVINKIYGDGFQDGFNAGIEEENKDDFK